MRATRKLLTYGRQFLDEEDKRAVMEVLDGDWLTQGPAAGEFEGALCERFDVDHAVVCANGTAALHLVALALDWSPGDVVIVPAITFLASANCCAYVGAEPYFVDVEDDSFTIDPARVEEAIDRLRGQGRTVRGIVGVDLAGHPCNWSALRAIADREGLSLVDDACHAMGATYDHGVKVGSCTHPDVTVLSFHPVKHITSGEGGAVLTNDAVIANRVRKLLSHGIERGPDEVPGWEGPWHYDMAELGYNYRLTDLQGALGLSQLRKLDRFLAHRREVASWYDDMLSGSPVFRGPTTAPGAEHAYHLYLLRARFGDGLSSRQEFFARCLEQGVQLQVHYRPVPLNTYYQRFPENREVASRLPVSMRYYSEVFSVPIHPAIDYEDVAYVVETLTSSLHK